MSDFKSILLAAISDAVPELAGKIQAGAVDEKTSAPFAAFDIPEERVVRTLDGIAGYETTFELAVYDTRFAGADFLKKRIVAAIDGLQLQDRRCRFRSSSTDYFPDYDLHGISMTFRII